VAQEGTNSPKLSELESESPEVPLQTTSGTDSTEGGLEDAGAYSDTRKSDDDAAKIFQDKYMRLAADFENYKRISQRDQRDASRYANEVILKDLLPIIDNLERAVRFAKEKPSADGLLKGVELTLKQFSEALGRFGVKPVASIGKLFDPACHQAVTRLESATAPENTVMEEYQKGYRLHERILRAAMVAIAGTPAGKDSEETPPDESS